MRIGGNSCYRMGRDIRLFQQVDRHSRDPSVFLAMVWWFRVRPDMLLHVDVAAMVNDASNGESEVATVVSDARFSCLSACIFAFRNSRAARAGKNSSRVTRQERCRGTERKRERADLWSKLDGKEALYPQRPMDRRMCNAGSRETEPRRERESIGR